MDMPSRLRLPLIVQCVLFLIPVNIYVIGDWLAAGVQWILFRFQQSYLGNSFIVFTKDMSYVEAGVLKGKSVVAAEVGILATCLMVIAVCMLILAFQKRAGIWVKAGAVLSICGGCLYLVSDMIQYGIFFQNPSGFVIPIGVPVILLTGIWMYRLDFTDAGIEESDPSEIL